MARRVTDGASERSREVRLVSVQVEVVAAEGLLQAQHFEQIVGREPGDLPQQTLQLGVIVFFLQIDTLTQKNSSRDNHLQNWLSRTACAFGAD